MQFMWHGGKQKAAAAALEHAIWTCEQFSGSSAACLVHSMQMWENIFG